MNAPRIAEEAVRIIAQSQFDVNEENIDGADAVVLPEKLK